MARDEQRARVFISFASADRDIARHVSDHIESGGITTFFAPLDIAGGMNFALEIVKAIASCDVVLVLLSPMAAESPHVRREVSLAVQERRMLLPLALPGTRYPTAFSTEWTYWLSAVQVEDYDGAEQTLRRLRSILPPDRPGDTAVGNLVSRRVPMGKQRRKLGGQNPGPSALLRPDSAMPALLGRDTELARLEQWCLRESDFDARLVVGSGGQGKTRLARELIHAIEARGWRTRFLAPADRGVEVILDLSDQPTLLVVDYAEARRDQLLEILGALLEYGIHDKVRLLLLARSASDWWNGLLAWDADVADLLADVTVQPLVLLTQDRETVNQLFTSAYEQFAATLALTPSPMVAAPYKTYVSVLEVLEDALVCVLDAGHAPGSGSERLLAHERRYLSASAAVAGIKDLDDADLNRIAAALTLYGAANEGEASQIIDECISGLTPIERRKVARLFRRLYPGPQTFIDGLRPDALAEDLLAGVLDTDGQLPASAGAATRSPDQQRRALFRLAGGAMRHPVVAAELERIVLAANIDLLLLGIEVATQVEEPDRLGSAIEAAVERASSEELPLLLSAVPDETVALANLAAQLAKRAIADLPDPEHQTLQDVVTAMECSNRFSDAGWSLRAADSARVAVGRLRLLNPDSNNLRVLGRALSNLSNRLWELGGLSASLGPAREAVRCLNEADAPPFERAAARSNLAFRLAELGNHVEALAELRVAERLCEAPRGEDHSGWAKTRGSVMNNLTCVLLGTGDASRATVQGLGCVELRRSQALQNRDRWLPNVARALANAAPAAEAAGKRVLADRLLLEARSLHRLTGARAPILRFEEAESATLASIILLVRRDWDSAAISAEHARGVLKSIQVDLGALSSRLDGTLTAILGASKAKEELSLLDIARGTHATIQLPRLLEYRDL